MLKSLHIEGFRCFKDFTLSDLGRVNLLTGYNNGGKTTVLEAVQAISTSGKLDWLQEIAVRRGEYQDVNDESSRTREFDLSHLFHNHRIELKSRIAMNGDSDSGKIGLDLFLESADKDTLFRVEQQAPDSHGTQIYNAVAEWTVSSGTTVRIQFPLVNGRMSKRWWPTSEHSELPSRPVRFLTTSSFAPERVVSWFNRILLTPEEDVVLEALRIVDSRIERVAPLTTRFTSRGDGRQAFLVKLTDINKRLPLGNLGDGVWRILCVALGMATSRGGMLLIDEIDTGLHYTTLEKMWRFVYQAAKRLNVQVFATTHSGDCIKSLAAIAEEVKDDGPDAITIQHIDCEKKKSVAFDRRGVVVAAEQEIEVR